MQRLARQTLTLKTTVRTRVVPIFCSFFCWPLVQQTRIFLTFFATSRPQQGMCAWWCAFTDPYILACSLSLVFRELRNVCRFRVSSKIAASHRAARKHIPRKTTTTAQQLSCSHAPSMSRQQYQPALSVLLQQQQQQQQQGQHSFEGTRLSRAQPYDAPPPIHSPYRSKQSVKGLGRQPPEAMQRKSAKGQWATAAQPSAACGERRMCCETSDHHRRNQTKPQCSCNRCGFDVLSHRSSPCRIRRESQADAASAAARTTAAAGASTAGTAAGTGTAEAFPSIRTPAATAAGSSASVEAAPWQRE